MIAFADNLLLLPPPTVDLEARERGAEAVQGSGMMAGTYKRDARLWLGGAHLRCRVPP